MKQRDKYIPELENLEIDLLLQAVHRLHGVNLQEYSFMPLRRRIWEAIRREKVRTVSALQEKLIHDPEAMARFLATAIPPRHSHSPEFYRKFRSDLLPVLRTYPFIRIWQAGCGSVFELYNLVILLVEEGLYEKSVIYTTDANEPVVLTCQDGHFPLENLEGYRKFYLKSGGRNRLEMYFSGGGESGTFDASLRKNMVFAQHNLATDSSFNEFNAVFCRQSLKWFNRPTQERAFRILHESLVLFGILGLVPGDNPSESTVQDFFIEMDPEHHLYKKVS